VFASVAILLNVKICALIDDWNDRSHPFAWIKTAEGSSHLRWV